MFYKSVEFVFLCAGRLSFFGETFAKCSCELFPAGETFAKYSGILSPVWGTLPKHPDVLSVKVTANNPQPLPLRVLPFNKGENWGDTNEK